MKKIVFFLFMVLFTGGLASCVTWEPTQPPLIRIENVHDSGSKKVAFSPAGKYLASSGLRGEIKIWSVPDLTLLQIFTAHHDTPRGIVWLDDEKLVSGDDDGRMLLWDSSDNTVISARNSSSAVGAMVFLPEKKLIVSGHADGFVRAFKASGLDQMAGYSTGAGVFSVAASRVADLLAVSNRKKSVVLLDAGLQSPQDLTPPPLSAIEVAFSPDAGQLAGGNWFKLLFWDIPSGRLKVVKSDHWGIAFSLDYTPDGLSLAIIGRVTDSEIYLVDPRTGRLQRHLLRPRLCGAAVRISPDGRFLASASDDGSIRLYNLKAPYEPVD